MVGFFIASPHSICALIWRMTPKSNIHDVWDAKRWPNFSESEMACRHCGESFLWLDFLDRLQDLRQITATPLYILSAHRCALHNARIGGAPLSEHLSLAVDISLYRHDRFVLAETAKRCGFTGFGYYATFLHLDLGRPRHWYGGQKARQLWQMH